MSSDESVSGPAPRETENNLSAAGKGGTEETQGPTVMVPEPTPTSSKA